MRFASGWKYWVEFHPSNRCLGKPRKCHHHHHHHHRSLTGPPASNPSTWMWSPPPPPPHTI
eukprot:5814034-Amphidinium_carterae.1